MVVSFTDVVYLAAPCAIVVLPLLFVIARFLHSWLWPKLRVLTARFKHSRLPFLPLALDLTWLRLSLLLLYIAANVVILRVPTGDDEPTLERKSAQAASMNLVVLFLAGRTNPLADLLQIPLPTFYFAHRWVGVVTIVEALLHAALVLSRRRDLDALGQSGLLAAGSLLLIPILYPWFFKNPWQHLSKVHLVLALAALAGWTWHVLLQRSAFAKACGLATCGLWCSTHAYRLGRIFASTRNHGIVDYVWEDGETTSLSLTMNRPVRIFPGCYFYIFFRRPLPFYNLLHGYPMMLLWSEPGQFSKGRATELSFLISQKGHHRLPLEHTRKGNSIRLDGPYGKDLRLQEYENVLLAAKGMGITGILPFALHLAGRQRHDDKARDPGARLRDSDEAVFRDLTRNVDVFWWLEHNSQENWVRDQLRALQELNAATLVVWCIYPSPRKDEKIHPLFRPDDFFRVKYDVGLNDFARELRQEARFPGRTLVLACGDGTFMGTMRETVLGNTTPERFINLVELEYQPHLGETVPPAAETFGALSARIVSADLTAPVATESVEMQNVDGRARPAIGPSRVSPSLNPGRRATRRVSRML